MGSKKSFVIKIEFDNSVVGYDAESLKKSFESLSGIKVLHIEKIPPLEPEWKCECGEVYSSYPIKDPNPPFSETLKCLKCGSDKIERQDN